MPPWLYPSHDANATLISIKGNSQKNFFGTVKIEVIKLIIGKKNLRFNNVVGVLCVNIYYR
jgi:hypothetical protein